MIVVDDEPVASRTVRKGPTKLSPGKKNSTQTTTKILVLHSSSATWFYCYMVPVLHDSSVTWF